MQTVAEIAAVMPVLFPVHPRTRDRIMQLQLGAIEGVHLCDPLPYLAFVGLMAKARVVLTDSGGIQEETTALNVPCLTLRRNTERPVTITNGTNRLVGDDGTTILAAFQEVLLRSPGRSISLRCGTEPPPCAPQPSSPVGGRGCVHRAIHEQDGRSPAARARLSPVS